MTDGKKKTTAASRAAEPQARYTPGTITAEAATKAAIRTAVAATEPKPLYVVLEPGEKEKYEGLARELGVTMRDLVRRALEKEWLERNLKIEERNRFWHGLNDTFSAPEGSPELLANITLGAATAHATAEAVQAMSRRLMDYEARLARLEAQAGQFHGGLLANAVMGYAHELALRHGDGSDGDWVKNRRAYLLTAYLQTVERFPNPLRRDLLADAEYFVNKAIGGEMAKQAELPFDDDDEDEGNNARAYRATASDLISSHKKPKR